MLIAPSAVAVVATVALAARTEVEYATGDVAGLLSGSEFQLSTDGEPLNEIDSRATIPRPK